MMADSGGLVLPASLLSSRRPSSSASGSSMSRLLSSSAAALLLLASVLALAAFSPQVPQPSALGVKATDSLKFQHSAPQPIRPSTAQHSVAQHLATPPSATQARDLALKASASEHPTPREWDHSAAVPQHNIFQWEPRHEEKAMKPPAPQPVQTLAPQLSRPSGLSGHDFRALEQMASEKFRKPGPAFMKSSGSSMHSSSAPRPSAPRPVEGGAYEGLEAFGKPAYFQSYQDSNVFDEFSAPAEHPEAQDHNVFSNTGLAAAHSSEHLSALASIGKAFAGIESAKEGDIEEPTRQIKTKQTSRVQTLAQVHGTGEPGSQDVVKPALMPRKEFSSKVQQELAAGPKGLGAQLPTPKLQSTVNPSATEQMLGAKVQQLDLDSDIQNDVSDAGNDDTIDAILNFDKTATKEHDSLLKTKAAQNQVSSMIKEAAASSAPQPLSPEEASPQPHMVTSGSFAPPHKVAEIQREESVEEEERRRTKAAVDAWKATNMASEIKDKKRRARETAYRSRFHRSHEHRDPEPLGPLAPQSLKMHPAEHRAAKEPEGSRVPSGSKGAEGAHGANRAKGAKGTKGTEEPKAIGVEGSEAKRITDKETRGTKGARGARGESGGHGATEEQGAVETRVHRAEADQAKAKEARAAKAKELAAEAQAKVRKAEERKRERELRDQAQARLERARKAEAKGQDPEPSTKGEASWGGLLSYLEGAPSPQTVSSSDPQPPAPKPSLDLDSEGAEESASKDEEEDDMKDLAKIGEELNPRRVMGSKSALKADDDVIAKFYRTSAKASKAAASMRANLAAEAEDKAEIDKLQKQQEASFMDGDQSLLKVAEILGSAK